MIQLAKRLIAVSIPLFLFLEPSLMSWTASRTFSTRTSSAKRVQTTKKAKVSSKSKNSRSTSAQTRKLKSPKVPTAKRRRSRSFRAVDPTIGDVAEGEEVTVRAAAVEALGHIDGSVVVVDPSNGRILSIVNQKLALNSGYQPCSTFKLAVTLAGLSEGVFTKDSEFRCLSRHRGYLNLTDALAYSCNEYFQNVGERLGFDRVKSYAQQFGFGERAGLNIEGERTGVFPNEIDDEWIRRLSSHGQFIEATPLEMAAFVSAVANGGILYYLQYPRSQEEIMNFQPRMKRHLEISSVLPDLKEGMSGSVTYGSGKRAYDPLEPVYGKTGSCNGQGTQLGWFVSYAGDSHSKLVVVVLIRGSRYGDGPYAALVAGKIYRGLSQQNYFARKEEGLSTNTTSGTENGLTLRNDQH